jgi:putative salt-induced outer membrane protein
MVFLVIPGAIFGLIETVPAETKVWSDVAELSFVKTGGNTDVQNLLVNNALKYLFTEQMTGTWNLHILNGETDNTRTAERYETELRSDYKYSEKLYSFGNAIWLQDKFAGLDPREYFGAGAGYRILNGPYHTLLAEAGLNYTVERFTDGTDRDYMGGRLFGKYIYAFTEKNTFSQSAEYIPDFQEQRNYFVNSETAIVSALNGYLSLKASYVMKYNNEPPIGKKNLDTMTSTTLVVNF